GRSIPITASLLATQSSGAYPIATGSGGLWERDEASRGIALVLAFGVQAPAHFTADRRTPVEIHFVSWGRRCDAVDPDFVAGFDGAFSAESLAISGSTPLRAGGGYCLLISSPAPPDRPSV